jgi:hypothetical protein
MKFKRLFRILKNYMNSVHPQQVIFTRYLRYAQILIFKIYLYIPPVKIFACLDPEQTISSVRGRETSCDPKSEFEATYG